MNAAQTRKITDEVLVSKALPLSIVLSLIHSAARKGKSEVELRRSDCPTPYDRDLLALGYRVVEFAGFRVTGMHAMTKISW